MKVLVTGGAGYIGSVVSAAMLERGHEVVVYDDLSKGHRAAVPRQATFVQGSVDDRAKLDELFRTGGFNAVMHFAASIEAGESMFIPQKFFRNNSAATLTLLEAMLEQGISRFVFSSTAALYGNPERTPIEESDTLKPTNAYGESKLLVEQMLAWFHRIHGLRYASLRYFNASGATETLGEDHHPESHLIPLVLDVASGKREVISIHGADYPTKDGTCVRDYVHVADLASAHVLAVERLGSAAQPEQLIYNLGSGHGFSVREVIDVASKVTGKTIRVHDGPRRAGDPATLVASPQKIQRELGWAPKYHDLNAIIESAWKWRVSHPDGYGDAE